MDFKKATFIKSAPDVTYSPEHKLSEVLFVGRSNVGKSSLINALCQRKSLAFVSSNPGHTKLLNYYLIDDSFYLVDAPGYGYQKGKQDAFISFGELMEGYFSSDRKISLVVLLLDARRELNEDDIDIIKFLEEEKYNYLLVLTKADKCNQKEIYASKKYLTDTLKVDDRHILLSSIRKEKGLETLRKAISAYI